MPMFLLPPDPSKRLATLTVICSLYFCSFAALGQSASPCSEATRFVVDGFPAHSAVLDTARQQTLNQAARRVVDCASQTQSVLVEGFADVERDPSIKPEDRPSSEAEHSQRRANEVKAALQSRVSALALQEGRQLNVRFDAVARGATQLRGSSERNRRAEISLNFTSPVIPSSQKHISLTVKSFIAPIGSALGVPYCQPNSVLFGALGRTTDFMMSENPVDDKAHRGESKPGYRLFSHLDVELSCNGNAISMLSPPRVESDVGQECMPGVPVCGHPPPLQLEGPMVTKTSSDQVTIKLLGKSRPPDTVEPIFQTICPRTSRFIWHELIAEFQCKGGTVGVVTRLNGSAFPSHRLFIDGQRRGDVPQHELSRLWEALPSNTTMVR